MRTLMLAAPARERVERMVSRGSHGEMERVLVTPVLLYAMAISFRHGHYT